LRGEIKIRISRNSTAKEEKQTAAEKGGGNEPMQIRIPKFVGGGGGDRENKPSKPERGENTSK